MYILGDDLTEGTTCQSSCQWVCSGNFKTVKLTPDTKPDFQCTSTFISSQNSLCVILDALLLVSKEEVQFSALAVVSFTQQKFPVSILIINLMPSFLWHFYLFNHHHMATVH